MMVAMSATLSTFMSATISAILSTSMSATMSTYMLATMSATMSATTIASWPDALWRKYDLRTDGRTDGVGSRDTCVSINCFSLKVFSKFVTRWLYFLTCKTKFLWTQFLFESFSSHDKRSNYRSWKFRRPNVNPIVEIRSVFNTGFNQMAQD